MQIDSEELQALRNQVSDLQLTIESQDRTNKDLQKKLQKHVNSSYNTLITEESVLNS